MFGVSHAENLIGRINAAGGKLRRGQEKLIGYVSDNPAQPVYNGVLPTGYGKSITALGVCDVLKSQGRATRFLFIVPTDTQRTQYAEDIGESVRRYGLNLRLHNDILPNNRRGEMPIIVDGSTKVHRANRENRCEIYITTIQHVVADKKSGGFYADLMAAGQWCVFCDEYQKYNADEKAEWGKAIEKLNRTVMFGLTATPIRTDSKLTVFGSKVPDVEVSLDDAYKEQAIRGVRAHIEHYFVDVENSSGEIDRLTTETIESNELSTELRYVNKYVSSIICSAYACLIEKNRRYEKQNQMLVFAMNVRHAKMVSETMNAMFGAGFSDWVGVGPDGRADSAEVIARYKENKIACLVQVDLAGEGFNNPRSSVLVFLHLLRKATVKAVQQAGRGLRRNYGIPIFEDDICDIFASPDTEMAELAIELANRTLNTNNIGDESDGEGEGKDRRAPIYSIPSFDPLISDVEHQRTEIISKISNAMLADVRGGKALSSSLTEGEVSAVSDERLRVLIAEHFMSAADNAAGSIEKSFKERVSDAQSILVSNVLRLRYGQSIQKGLAGDIHKALNSRWLRESGGMRHDAMFEEDFRKKHEWLQAINDSIRTTREIPQWLQL